MLNFFREGLYYFYLALFMPVTLQEITRKLPLNKALMICSAGYFIACMMTVFLLGLIGWICSLLQCGVYLFIDFQWVFLGFFILLVLSLGLFFGVSIGFGLGVGLIFVVIIGGGVMTYAPT